VISRAVSARIAELASPDQPDSPEFPVGQGHGYLWRVNKYWRLEEKDGGVYTQVESIALSRDVPAIFAWLVNPLIRRISRQTLANLLSLCHAAGASKPRNGSRHVILVCLWRAGAISVATISRLPGNRK
jgi:hypothetical protein